MGDWYNYIKGAADNAALKLKQFSQTLFPSFSNMALVPNPVILAVKMSGPIIGQAASMATDASIRAAGFEPFAPLPDNYAVDEQYTADVQSHSILSLATDYATVAKDKVVETVSAAADLLTPGPNSSSDMPLWVKAAVIGAVLLGSVVMVQSIMSNRHA